MALGRGSKPTGSALRAAGTLELSSDRTVKTRLVSSSKDVIAPSSDSGSGLAILGLATGRRSVVLDADEFGSSRPECGATPASPALADG